MGVLFQNMMISESILVWVQYASTVKKNRSTLSLPPMIYFWKSKRSHNKRSNAMKVTKVVSVPKPKSGVVAKGNPSTAKKAKSDGMKKPGKC